MYFRFLVKSLVVVNWSFSLLISSYVLFLVYNRFYGDAPETPGINGVISLLALSYESFANLIYFSDKMTRYPVASL